MQYNSPRIHTSHYTSLSLKVSHVLNNRACITLHDFTVEIWCKNTHFFANSKKYFSISQKVRIFAPENKFELYDIMNCVNLNISLPRSDMGFMCMLSKRMGWNLKEMPISDALFDPESGEYLNEETMQAIRDVEAGKGVARCNNIDELLAVV